MLNNAKFVLFKTSSVAAPKIKITLYEDLHNNVVAWETTAPRESQFDKYIADLIYFHDWSVRDIVHQSSAVSTLKVKLKVPSKIEKSIRMDTN